MAPHPFDPLTMEELLVARQTILDENQDNLIDFREIYLREPAKELMKQFLELEHTGKLNYDTLRPPRLAKVQYDVIGPNKKFEFHEASVDVHKKTIETHEVIDDAYHANLTMFVRNIHTSLWLIEVDSSSNT
jgi:primary-amine oxidase